MAAAPRAVTPVRPHPSAAGAFGRRRANLLDGRTWARYSISIWSDVRKSAEERRLGHPAAFPLELAIRLIRCFAGPGDRVVLDPFCGTGAVPLAAEALGLVGVGVELSEAFCQLARSRPLPQAAGGLPDGLPPLGEGGRRIIHQGDARQLRALLERESVDLVITSPPYWDILLRPRTADYKPVRHYGPEGADLGKVPDYRAFLDALAGVFGQVREVLRPGKYCLVIVMDLRKKNRFYPFHADLAARMVELGFEWDDLIVWDRRHEYNHLRPLGYPARFRINKVHEYILIFRKPESGRAALPQGV